MIIGVTAMIISLSTLIVFIYQTNLIRKQQYMSVYPHLDLTNSNTGSLNYTFLLSNMGVGPAFIRDIDVKHKNGKTYRSLVHYVNSTVKEEDSLYFHYSDIYEGRLVQADEQIILFGLSDKKHLNSIGKPANTVNGALKLNAILNTDSLNIKITYESIYGERWYITEKALQPIKI